MQLAVTSAIATLAWAIPIATLAGLRRFLVAVFAGRDGTWQQLLYVAPSLVGWLTISAALGLAVILMRVALVRRLRSGHALSDSAVPHPPGR
jgi:hypothetical protein